jgi:hypothetical protein
METSIRESHHLNQGVCAAIDAVNQQPGVSAHTPEQLSESVRERVLEVVRDRVVDGMRAHAEDLVPELIREALRERLGHELGKRLRPRTLVASTSNVSVTFSPSG